MYSVYVAHKVTIIVSTTTPKMYAWRGELRPLSLLLRASRHLRHGGEPGCTLVGPSGTRLPPCPQHHVMLVATMTSASTKKGIRDISPVVNHRAVHVCRVGLESTYPVDKTRMSERFCFQGAVYLS